MNTNTVLLMRTTDDDTSDLSSTMIDIIVEYMSMLLLFDQIFSGVDHVEKIFLHPYSMHRIFIECSPMHPIQPYSLIGASSSTLSTSVSRSKGFSHGLSTFRTPLRNPNIPPTDTSSPDGPNP